jgi:hypothetical protein
MKSTLKELIDDLDNLTLDSPAGTLKKYFPLIDPEHLKNLREKIWKRIKEEDMHDE